MGYNMRYSFGIVDPNDAVRFPGLLKEIITEVVFNPFEEECKWYEYQKDCETVSLRFPNVTFYIDGQGEEADDCWRHFFKDGRSQKCVRPEWTPPKEPTWTT